MKLIALIFGLGLERIATQVLHLRELRWFDPYFDFGLDRLRGANVWLVYPGSVLLVLLPLIPWLGPAGLLQTGVAWDLPYLLFAVLVLFFCLAPGTSPRRWKSIARPLRTPIAARVLSDLCEVEHSGAKDVVAVEEAIFMQAPTPVLRRRFLVHRARAGGRWLFRVSDLLRGGRRRSGSGSRSGSRLPWQRSKRPTALGVVARRLAVLGYALSGNFDEAVNCWRQFELKSDLSFHHSNDQVVACVGKAAMGGTAADISDPGIAAAAMNWYIERSSSA